MNEERKRFSELVAEVSAGWSEEDWGIHEAARAKFADGSEGGSA